MNLGWIRAVLRRDLLILKDTPWSVALTLASTVLGVMVFGLLGRFVGEGGEYVTYVLTGITFLRVTDAVVQSPGAGLREERSRGSLEMLVDAPQPSWALVAASAIVPSVRCLVEGTLALGIASASFHAGIDPGLRGLVAVPVAVLSVLLLAVATGLFLAAASLQSRAATAATSFFGLAVAMTGQVYYPSHALPGWLQGISHVSPYTAALKCLRAALVHGPGLWTSLAVTLGSAALVFSFGAWLMERAVRQSRATGALARG